MSRQPTDFHASADSSSGGDGGMVPYLHFTGTDTLIFKAWTPKSPGAIAGACIGLLCLALFERWVSGMRSVLEARWRQKYVTVGRSEY
jgi:copper transporter 1